MKLQDTISSLLKKKGEAVWSITPEVSVYQAVERMAEKGIGALLVMSEGKLVGILSERDYARKVVLKGRSSKEATVSEIMTTPVHTVNPHIAVDECMALMTQHRIRHLPVVEHEKVLAVVSIGDIVKWIVSRQEETIHEMESYISQSYPA